MRRVLATVLLLLTAVTWASARGLEPAPGSPVWMEAATAQEALPGEAPEEAREGELEILREVFAGRYLDRAERALRSLDLAEVARALAKASYGVEEALAPLEALRILITLVERRPTPQNSYPPVVHQAGFDAFLREARERLPRHLKGRALTPGGLEAWIAEIRPLCREHASRPWPVDSLPETVLRSWEVGAPTWRSLAGTGTRGLGAVQAAYAELAWLRRAIFLVLGAEGIEPTLALRRTLGARQLRVEGKVTCGKGGADQELVLSLGGGRLGTVTRKGSGEFAFDLPLARLAQYLIARPVVPLRVVENRRVVFQRDLAAGSLFTRARPVEGAEATSRISLEPILLADPAGSLKVLVPAWKDLLAGKVPGQAPTRGAIRLAGEKDPGELSEWGTVVFREVSPGWRFFAFTAKDDAGTILYRSFGTVEVLPGQEVTAEVSLPVGEAPPPAKQKSIWSVTHYMKKLAAAYRSGSISHESFRKAIGKTYRLHRNFYGDPKKDKKFTKEVTAAMREVMLSVQPTSVEDGDLTPRLKALGESFQDLREILPDTLRKSQPASELEKQVVELSEGLFAEEVPGEYRSVLHLEWALRKGQQDVDELAGLTSLLEDAVRGQLEALLGKLRAVSEEYREGYTVYHLAGFDYEEKLLRLAAEDYLPLAELLVRGERLRAERTAADLSSRARDEALRVGAVEARLRSFRTRLGRLRERARESAAAWEQARARGASLWEGVSEGRRGLLDTWRRTRPEHAGDPRPWLRDPGVGPFLAKLFEVDRARVGAETWRERYEFQVKTNLAKIFELDAEEAELEVLMELHPSERRKALNQKLSPIFRDNALDELGEGTWPSSLPRGAYRTHQLVLGAHAGEALSLAPFLEERERALESLEARFDPATPAIWPPLAGDLAAWIQSVQERQAGSRFHDSVLGEALRERALALEGRLRERIATRPVSAFSEAEVAQVRALGATFLGEPPSTAGSPLLAAPPPVPAAHPSPEPSPDPAPDPAPEPAPEPSPAPAPTPEATPEPTPASNSDLSPGTEPSPEATPEPEPISSPDPAPVPTPEVMPAPAPAPAPSPEPVPAPTPETTPEPSPEPAPAPTPETTPEPSPEPVPAPTPEATPEPAPAPTPEATPDPTPAPAEPLPPEFAPQDGDSIPEHLMPLPGPPGSGE